LIDDVAGLVAKTLGISQRVLVVSPAFLYRCGRPEKPADLPTLDDIFDGGARWTLTNLAHRTEQIELTKALHGLGHLSEFQGFLSSLTLDDSPPAPSPSGAAKTKPDQSVGVRRAVCPGIVSDLLPSAGFPFIAFFIPFRVNGSTPFIRGKSPMRAIRTWGSVRGVPSNQHPTETRADYEPIQKLHYRWNRRHRDRGLDDGSLPPC
jgi:hypothetical protein